MLYDDVTVRDRTVLVRLTTTATRPPGRRQTWTAQAGHWHATASTEKAAADALAERLQQFLMHYEAPRLLTFRGHTAVVELAVGDGTLYWKRHIVTPDGRVTLSVFGANGWAEAETEARYTLAQQSTDWQSDASVHEAAAYLDRVPRDDDRFGSAELYRYAAWQRAARAAIDNGRTDWHEWAGAHHQKFTIAPPTE
ncbi:hypothetical protein [Kibdelosporangium phytohabitans]|uniref:Uncharacterized protein n=1 Tax=Kibdelosporangium phytohabitans TaxID=860235 RepID=A0A0N9HSQ0_9PSEU|nr:hypothetical protein [Kibdelosporangium phytohabitans]ALG06323.1 hypothetical protein AOZ06_04750 [Kibdelosporangium phytohabitans]MBE1467453.1 hypothetical protein [Kibdelosporangium phytohabitans]